MKFDKEEVFPYLLVLCFLFVVLFIASICCPKEKELVVVHIPGTKHELKVLDENGNILYWKAWVGE